MDSQRAYPVEAARQPADTIDWTGISEVGVPAKRFLYPLVGIGLLALLQQPTRAARPELDLQGSRSRCREMARLLLSLDPADWREAEVRLASAGPAALAAIDDPRLLRTTVGLRRVRGVIALSLVRSTTPRDVRAHPRLERLVADSVARGFALASVLEAQKGEYLSPHHYSGMFWDRPQRPRPPTTTDQMLALGGCAVPAALDLLHSQRPLSRAYGLTVLLELGASANFADTIATLVGDLGSFLVDYDCYSARETVGQHASNALKNKYAVKIVDPKYPGMVYEDHGLDSDLINAIRSVSQSLKATSWDQWWDGARPVWRDWWRLTGEGRRPPDRWEWINIENEYSGFRWTRDPSREPRTLLRVVGPPGARCRIVTDSMTVAEGEVPLEFVRQLDSVSVARRRERAMRGDYSFQWFGLEATLPEGGTFQREGFLWEDDDGSPGLNITFEVLAAPRRLEAGSSRRHR